MDIKIRKDGFFIIPEFENYAFNPISLVVKNLNTDTEIMLIKTKRIKKYKLSKNGNTYYLTAWDIIEIVIKKYF